MTTVVYRNGVMAADKMACEGSNKSGKMTKIFRVNGYLVGFSGAADCAAALLRWFENGADEEAWPDPYNKEDPESTMLVVSPAGQVMFYERFPVPIIMENEFFAIGSGADFALGAMQMGADAKTALEVAISLDAYTGNGIDMLSL